MFKRIYLLLLLPLLLTGCIQSESLLTINKNGSAVFEQRYTVPTELFQGQDARLIFSPEREKKISLLEQKTNMKIKELKSAKKVGLLGTRKLYNLATDEWNTEVNTKFYEINTSSPEGKIVDVKKNFFMTEYIVDIGVKPVYERLDDSEAVVYESRASMYKKQAEQPQQRMNEPQNEGEGEEQPEEGGQAIEEQEEQPYNVLDEEELKTIKNTFMIKTPIRASSHNSTNFDSKKHIYKWTLKYDTYNPVKLKFCIYNYVNIITVIIILLFMAGEAYYFLVYKKEQ